MSNGQSNKSKERVERHGHCTRPEARARRGWRATPDRFGRDPAVDASPRRAGCGRSELSENVPPGVDFSNDPLLQGRNFSYLDTQLKRLGGPNFTHIPINAPKCPFAHFQQDGHMAMRNPVGHVNYQPNSFGEGPRESPQRGFRSFADVEQGPKRRLRAESFADHYSQARQFFISQTMGEQTHTANALTFELNYSVAASAVEALATSLIADIT
jgi:catalase